MATWRSGRAIAKPPDQREEECATRINHYQYKVNEGVAIRSHKLTLSKVAGRSIRTVVQTEAGATVHLDGRTLVSEKVFVEEHRNCRWWWPFVPMTTYPFYVNTKEVEYTVGDYTQDKGGYGLHSTTPLDYPVDRCRL